MRDDPSESLEGIQVLVEELRRGHSKQLRVGLTLSLIIFSFFAIAIAIAIKRGVVVCGGV